MSKQRTDLVASKKPFGTLRGKLLGLVALLALLVSLFSPMVAGRTVAAATLSPSVASGSGQQWPAGLWQTYQRVHPLTASNTYTQSAEFSATDTAGSDNFGYAVSVSSDGATALISAPFGNSGKGEVYIFTKSGNVWSQVAELTASDAASNDEFGYAVSVSSDGATALIGAPFHNSNAGEAYIFTKGSGWITGTETARLTASDAASNDEFGYAVSVSSDGATALIGAYAHNDGAGEAYIFTKGSVWVTGNETAKLTASDAVSHDSFGYAVSLSSDGTTALIGAVSHNFGAGEAYIFTKGSVWVTGNETAKLTASDGASGDNSGYAVSLSSDGATALIGAYNHNFGVGEAYVFTKGNGWVTGNETAKLTALGGASGDAFGYAVSVSSDGATALISAPGYNSSTGAAYVFTKGNGWVTGNETAELTPSDGVPSDSGFTGDQFGTAVSLSSDGATAFVGSPYHNNYAGAVYVFNAPTTAATTTTTTVSSAPNPSVYGQPITFTANVTPITVTGSVNFNLNNSTVYSATLDNTGAASFVTNTLAAGVYTATASYSGDSNDAVSTSSVITQTVNKDNSNVALTVSPTTSNLNQDIVYTATVTAASSSLVPTGSVVFSDTTTGTAIGQANLDSNGVAVLDTTKDGGQYLNGGSHNIVAIYNGDGSNSNYNSSTSSSVTVKVNSQSGVAVSSSLNPSVYGQSVTFTATVTGSNPTGSVVFSDTTMATQVGSTATVSNGVASISTSSLAVGNHNIVAIYSGDSNNSTSTSSSVNQVVNRVTTSATLVSSANPSVWGQSVTFTVTVTGSQPTGIVTFKDGSRTLSGSVNLNASGVATYTTSSLSAGTHSITTVYSGDTNNAGSISSVVSQVVNYTASTGANGQVNVSPYFNEVAFSPNTNRACGNLDGYNQSYSADAFYTATVTTNGVNFNLAPSSDCTNNGIRDTGQTVLVGATTPFNTLGFLGVATNGNYANQQFVVSYTDGTSITTTLSLSDWYGGPYYSGETKAYTMAYRNTSSSQDNRPFNIYQYGIAIDINRKVSSITLPNNSSVHLLAISLYNTTTTTLQSSANPSAYGQSVTFTATVAPATASGVVTFTDGANTLGTLTLAGGVASFSTSSLAVGSHSIKATYGGDSTDLSSSSQVLTQTVNPINSTVTLVSSLNPSVYGQPITLTANVTPITVTGSVNFNLDNSTVYSATLDGTGAATFVTNTLAAGVYTATASYSGDSNNAASTSSVVTQSVSKDDSNVALTVSPTTSNLNDDVVYTATVTAASSSLIPTGSVVFSDTTTGTEIGQANLDSNGVAVLDTTTGASKYLNGGSHNVVAIYNGDGSNSNYNSSTSNSQTVNVNSQSGVVVSSSLNPSVYGQSVTFTATVSITSTGGPTNANVATPQTVAFSIDGKNVAQNVAVVSGLATYITNTLSAGQHGVVATYTGGTNEQDSTSATYTQTVNPANTTVAITPAATNVGANQPTTITATVAAVAPGAGTPIGSVIFTDTTTATTLGTINLDSNGVAALTNVSFAILGAHNIEASYLGDSNFNTSTNNVNINVSQATTTALASSSNPAVYGQSVTFTATVSPATASGTITFTIDSSTVVATLNNGVATYVTDTLNVGQHSVQASYQGNANYGASSDSLTQTISPANTTTSLVANPTAINLNHSVTLTATVAVVAPGAGTPTGSVIFSDTTTGTEVGSVAVDGNEQAVLHAYGLNGGSHNIVAMYAGDTNFAASNSNAQTVDVTSPSGVVVSSSVNPSVYGQSVTFSATVNITSTATPNVVIHAAPPNTVTFLIDNNTMASNVAVVGGVATYTTNSLTAGQHSVVANYSGDTDVASASSAIYTQTVNPANTTTSLTSAPNPSALNQSVTLTATVAAVAPSSGTPTGSVVFTDTTTNTALGSGTLNANGVATISVSTLAVGTHSLAASYAGNANYNGSSAANVNQTVAANGSSLTLTSGPNPSTFGQSVTFTATVSPSAASGNISFTIDSKTVSASLNNGVATYVTSTFAVGSHSVTASYAGNSNYGSSTSNTVTQVVNAVQNNNPSYSYFLPFLSNNGVGANIVNTRGVSPKTSNYTTFVSIDNGNSNPVTFTITYYNAQGSVIGTDNNGGNAIAPNKRYMPASPLASGQNGSAVVTSSQPLNIVVSEAGTVNGIATSTSYTAVNVATDAASTIYAPIAINNAYGGYTTNFVLANLGTASTTATITYYSDNGTKAGTQSVSLAAHAQTNVTQASTGSSSLASGFSGWAIVSSSGNQPLSGQVVETNPNFGFLETVDMPGMSGKTLFVPTVFQNAFGNFNTGMQLVNPNGTAANVTVTYYRKDGTKITTSAAHGSFSIGANSDTSFYHSAASFPELNTPNGGFVGTAVVTSDQPLVAIVNQAGSLNSVQYNGAFGTVLTGAAKVSVPVAVKNAYGYTTGLQVTNVSSVASTATITYYDHSGNKVYSTTLKSDAGGAIPGYGSVNPYLGIESNLPSGFDGVAVVTADTSGAQFVVIANNASSTLFYTYANNS